MTYKQKIADLEKRVRDLEARPQMPLVVIPAIWPVIQPVPVYQPWPTPWNPPYIVGDPLPGQYPTITCAAGAN